MPASPQNKKRGGQPHVPDYYLWKRRLERLRLSSTTAAAEEVAANKIARENEEAVAALTDGYQPPTDMAYHDLSAYAGTEDTPEAWKRRLEHGRLSAMALGQSWMFQGPGAAAAGGDTSAQQMMMQLMMMEQALAAEEERKKKQMPATDIAKKLVKARMIMQLKKSFLQLCHNWIACWIFCPATFFLFFHYNTELNKTADMYKEESKKRPGPLPGEDTKIKQYLKNLKLMLAFEWLHWATFFCFWYGLLMLVLIILYIIYLAVKCAVTFGLSCPSG